MVNQRSVQSHTGPPKRRTEPGDRRRTSINKQNGRKRFLPGDRRRTSINKQNGRKRFLRKFSFLE